MLIALTTCVGGGRGRVEKEGARENRPVIITNIYNLFRVSLFHLNDTLMCMHAQEVFFPNKIYRKACNVF